MEKSALPLIVESDTNLIRKPGDIHPTPKEKGDIGNNLVKWLPKLIFLVLGLVILVEIGLAVNSLNKKNNPTSSNNKSVQKISDPRISLFAAKRPYKIGDNVSVTIGLTTGNNFALGSDIVLKYNPEYLEASSSGFIKGPIYDEYPGTLIDNKKGEIQLSGITKIDKKGFLGTGVFGKVNFKTKKSGKTTVMVDYISDNTSESNIIDSQTGKDILTKVDNLDLEIK